MPSDRALDGERLLRQREREFYRYYEPFCALASQPPPHVDLWNEDEASRHRPRGCPDATLTAFCQLGALRVGTRRCMLFFFDFDNAYVLAEATRTLSLHNDSVHDIEDGLWLGTIVIPRGLSVCEYTVNIPEANHGSNRDQSDAGIVHIINDLRDDTRFCDRPYVSTGPKARFYAGVPITTPAGVRIGAFCVLDDKPRDGLSDRDVDFLVDMSKAVMNHLEIIRARSEFSRGSTILSSLGSFFGEAAQTPMSTPYAYELNSPPPVEARPDYFGNDDAERSIDMLESTSTIDYAQAPGNRTSSGAFSHPASPRSTSPQAINTSTSYRRRLRKIPDTDGGVQDDVKRAFQTAAKLIRGAMAVDGMMFLDASAKSYGGSISSSSHAIYTDNSADATITSTDTAATDDSQRSDPEQPTQKPSAQDCTVLGQSILPQPDSLAAPHGPISERLLNSLLRRYPAGKIWMFNEDGGLSSSSETIQETAEDSHPSHGSTTLEEDDADPPQDSHRHRSRRPLHTSVTEQLRHLFSGVRSLCLTSMWDPVRGKVYGAALMWTFSPRRIFSPLGEMAYLRAFSDVIMAKIARIEARMESKAKSNFISSISHELRSPIHGILGGIDFLYERKHLDWSIVSQIENCGTLLADVIEHLLDYSQVNSTSRRSGTKPGGRGISDHRLPKGSAPTRLSLDTLAKLTEEAADAVFYSHCCTSETESKVDYILDISVETSLKCRLPVGAWKRLCINIIGNALKYTRDGHIKVSLKVSSRSRRRNVAILTVTDTGCGMSKEFLENGLFRAFSQENSLANGTGLGMSLVAKLVKGFGGKMEVQSCKDSGTTVIVTVPLLTQASASPEVSSKASHKDLKVCMVTPSDAKPPSPERGRDLQHTTISDLLASQGAVITQTEPDVNIMFEADALMLLKQRNNRASTDVPAIVLCNTFASATRLRDSPRIGVLGSHVEVLTQPFGIQKLTGAITKCLAYNPKRVPGLEWRPRPTPPPDHRVEELAISKYVKPRSSSIPRGFRLSVKRNEEVKIVPSNVEKKLGISHVTPPAEAAIPITIVVDSLPMSPSTQGPQNEPSKPLSNPSLLLVDDNRINLRLLVAWADKHKYPRQEATNGQEAVDVYIASALATRGLTAATVPAGSDVDGADLPDTAAASRPKPDLIFLDINMPVMDGFEAARRIRAFESKTGVARPATIVALTGLGSAEARREADECGIDVFLTKPVRPRELDKLLVTLGMGK